MIYEVKKLSNEELLHLYIKESYQFLASADFKISHNSLQSMKLNLHQLDKELERRKIQKFYNRA